MYQGKHTSRDARRAPRKKRHLRWNRQFVLLVSILALLIGIVGSSLAYLLTHTDPVENTFQPSRVTCEIQEPGWRDGYSKKQNVTVKNTGDTDAYIRVAIVATWVKKDNNKEVVYPEMPVLGDDYTLSTGADWTLNGGYYYYNSAVAPGGETSVLIEACEPVAGRSPEGYSLCVDIIADAVQSSPVTAVQQAWGFVPGSST